MQEKGDYMQDMPRQIVFVRHGESIRNISEGSRHMDEPPTYISPLTERGRSQAETVGEYIRTQFEPFDQYFTSTYLRTRETMRRMHGNEMPSPHLELAVLNERNRGAWAAPDEYKKLHINPLEVQRMQREDMYHYRGPLGESFADIEHRVTLFCEMLKRFPGQRVLIVGHRSWGVIFWRILLGKTVAETMSRHADRSIDPNTAVTVYENIDGVMTCVKESHLPVLEGVVI